MDLQAKSTGKCWTHVGVYRPTLMRTVENGMEKCLKIHNSHDNRGKENIRSENILMLFYRRSPSDHQSLSLKCISSFSTFIGINEAIDWLENWFSICKFLNKAMINIDRWQFQWKYVSSSKLFPIYWHCSVALFHIIQVHARPTNEMEVRRVNTKLKRKNCICVALLYMHTQYTWHQNNLFLPFLVIFFNSLLHGTNSVWMRKGFSLFL